MERAVAKAVQEIRDKADVIILLSQAGYDETHRLADKIPGIDLAVSAEVGRDISAKETFKTPVLGAPNRGTSLGYARLGIAETGT